ncbi:MAG: hypothetical protein AB1898_09310 [Acidobacteriota bacterium]
MPVELAEWVVSAAAGYALLGGLFALPFLTVGVGRVDPRARNAGWSFRLMILAGVVALWPVLLLRWRQRRTQPATAAARSEAR